MKNNLIGRYGGNDGIFLFPDGKFAMFGYATFVPGTYKINAGTIEFTPVVSEMFAIYGFKNPKLNGKVQMMFQGFNDGKIYVQFDEKTPQKVFNDDPNCLDWPFVTETTETPKEISFQLETSGNYELEFQKINNQWSFENEGYNDFIFVYNKPNRYQMPFQGLVSKTKDGEQYLELSANIGDRKLPHQDPIEDKKFAELQEIFKKEIPNDIGNELVYANEHYNMIYKLDEQYQLDPKTNLYFDTLNTKKNAKFETQSYHDTRFFKKYKQVKPRAKTDVKMGSLKVNNESIFFTSCEPGMRPNYKSPFKDQDTNDSGSDELKGVVPNVPEPKNK